jgi:P4 family phage/plasmid primase-like protien
MDDVENKIEVSVELDGNKVSLITSFNSGWKTIIVANGTESVEIPHKKPIYLTDKSRNKEFSPRITSAIAIKPNQALQILDALVKEADKRKDEIKVLETKNVREQNKTKIDKKTEIVNQVQMYYDILQNKDGTNSLEMIETAKIGLKIIMMPTFWRVNESGVVVLNKMNIASFLSKVYNTIQCGGHIWRYDWNNAYHTYDQNDEILKKAVSDVMDEVGQPLFQYNGSIKSDMEQVIVKAGLNNNVYTKSPFNKCKGMINTKNGVVKLDYKNREATLEGKKPGYIFNYFIDTIYDPAADSGPIDKFLEEVVGRDQKEIIYQMAALAIRDTDIDLALSKVAYFFIGPPHSGKNAIIDLLTKLLGTDNTSSIPLHELVEDRHIKASLEGKLLNVNDEAPHSLPLGESREIKALTGGKIHMMNPKGIQQYQSIITALLVFAGNQFPKCDIPETDVAFWGRWDLIHFRKIFQVNEKFTAGLFTPENMSGFFNKVIEKIFDINDNGIKRLYTPEDVYDEWQNNSNSVYCFINETMEKTIIPYTYLKRDIHKQYLDWCEDPKNNIPVENIKHQAEDFGRQIIRKCKAESAHSNNLAVYKMFRKMKVVNNLTSSNIEIGDKPESSSILDYW